MGGGGLVLVDQTLNLEKKKHNFAFPTLVVRQCASTRSRNKRGGSVGVFVLYIKRASA
jgi:hypothetical protein